MLLVTVVWLAWLLLVDVGMTKFRRVASLHAYKLSITGAGVRVNAVWEEIVVVRRLIIELARLQSLSIRTVDVTRQRLQALIN